MFTPPQPTSSPDRSSNIIKRLFYKYNDLPEQKFSEKMQIALKISDILFKTGQLTRLDNIKMKDLVKYTCDNLTSSVYQLDMYVNSNDRLSADISQHKTIVLKQYKSEIKREESDVIDKEYKQRDIQELLFITLHKVDVLINEALIKNHLLDFWS